MGQPPVETVVNGKNVFTPTYTTYANVQVRLANKVQFQTDDTLLEGQLPNQLLGQLICDAETEVEQDLRIRYAIPFQSKVTGQFVDLPDHSQRALRVAVDLMAVIKILETDFGRGTHVNAEDYFETSKKHYDEYIQKLLGNQPDQKGRQMNNYKRPPPLEQVRLAKSNREADDGYAGMIINTDASRHDSASYAAQQVNDPSRSYVNTLTGPGGPSREGAL